MKAEIELKPMVQFILEIDQMTTKEFCDKYNVPHPYFTGDVRTSADKFLQVDAIKHKMFVEHAKLLKRNTPIAKEWICVQDRLPEDGVEVIGYSKDWVHPDFNTNGTRVCFVCEGEWRSAKWNNDQDSWHTHAEWCCKENGGINFDPTQWMPFPSSL